MFGKARDVARELKAIAMSPEAGARPSPAMRAAVAPPAPAKKERNWELCSQAELIDHLVSHHHEGLRRDLPALVAEAKRIEREQAQHPAVPRGLADTLAALSSELESHMLSEESSVFPALRTGTRRGPIDMEIRMMGRDHDDHARHLERIRAQTANLTAPADASTDWAKLYADLVTLEAELRRHIDLEDGILFARAAGGA